MLGGVGYRQLTDISISYARDVVQKTMDVSRQLVIVRQALKCLPQSQVSGEGEFIIVKKMHLCQICQMCTQIQRCKLQRVQRSAGHWSGRVGGFLQCSR